ncbi:MAG TPA: dihydropteroate synthase [Armatimonadota bacterium]|nr:dihydropteroate synthase [Armatimonadota bacterium]HOM83742.1 dihydropteroate synthase [Armatimonadota bacterium]HOQ29393.1 dihydropteroate synthase [Armatimonadota bacterium]HPO73236.1 dihydropteroate synthase [Armatimonadota bacterium]HPT96453.1 dihydropteroate synthase [Armatimonadota bacterium]
MGDEGLARLVPEAARRTLVMGILNVTPDSFSDGGQHASVETALAHARRLLDEGADIIDVGGESTRPGADPVAAEEELRRVIPVIEGIRRFSQVPISVDTTKAVVARAAVQAGAQVINDVSGLAADPEIATVAASTGAYVVIMHTLGPPKTMQLQIRYSDVVADIITFLRRQIEVAVAAGIPRERIIIDPGIGFGKTVGHNLEILRRLREFLVLEQPILMGTSRKSFIGRVLDLPVDQRLEGTAATVALSIANGAAIVRVHDVLQMVRVARMTDAVLGRWSGE